MRYRSKWSRIREEFLNSCKETTCHYCGIIITKENCSVDHKIPLAKGGEQYNKDNLLLACTPCNNVKSAHPYEYFVQNFDKIRTGKLNGKFDYDKLPEIDKKFYDINRAKQISACFLEGKFEPDQVSQIKKHRSQSSTLVKFYQSRLTINFSEALPAELEDAIKEKVLMVVDKFGIPAKQFNAYVNKDATEMVFDISDHSQVWLNLETFEERPVSNKELTIFRKS